MNIVEIFTSPDNWISLLTLTLMEIVLGVDNVIFISIVTGHLPYQQQRKARSLGLVLALGIRIVLLTFIIYLAGMTNSIFMNLSFRDIVLLIGGIFLLYKSAMEIYEKIKAHEQNLSQKKKDKLRDVVLQVVIIDIVFSFDSIITAVGLSSVLPIMILAVVLSMFVMLASSNAVSSFINKYPGMKMLALSFLFVIGLMLVCEGFHYHIDKSYIYIAMLYAVVVETLNIQVRKRKH